MILAEFIKLKDGLYESSGINVHHARTMFTPTMFSRGRDIRGLDPSWFLYEMGDEGMSIRISINIIIVIIIVIIIIIITIISIFVITIISIIIISRGC